MSIFKYNLGKFTKKPALGVIWYNSKRYSAQTINKEKGLMKRRITVFILALTMVGAFTLIGCDKKDESGMEEVTQDVSEMAEEGVKATEEGVKAVGEKIKGAAEALPGMGEEAAEDVQETAGESAEDVEETAEGAAEEVQGAAEEAAEEAEY